MGGPHHARAGRHGGSEDLIDSEQLQRNGGTNDIDHGVVTTDLVKVHVPRCHAVQPPFGLSQQIENTECSCRHTSGQVGSLHQVGDVCMGSARAVVADPDQGSAARQPTSQDGLNRELPALNIEQREKLHDAVKIGTGVDQAAQRHVAGDAGEAVEPSDRGLTVVHRHGKSRATAQAAPKPLSMPTTVTPEAHEANMASRAVTPSNAAP